MSEGQYALEAILEMELERDLYAQGHISQQDAYDKGFIDELGIEQEGIQDAYNRSGGFTLESVNNELSHAIKDFDLACSHLNQSSLNKAATENLYKEVPTCNVCAKSMQAREGSYGKFYFCKCPEQKTVSDKYWQSVRRSNK